MRAGAPHPLLWPALIGVVTLATLGVMAYAQHAIKRVESELPLRVMQEKRDMERVARNFYEFLAATDAARTSPSGGVPASVEHGLASVERDLETLRSRYTFDTLIGASALHAVLSPVVDDVRIWLTEGFGALPPDSPLMLEVVATRVRNALGTVYDKTTEADRIAYEILERQSRELRALRERLLLVFLALGLLAGSFVWMALRQQRAARAQQASEAARVRAQERLQEAIESTSEGFAFFDEDERLVMCNTRYRDSFLSDVADLVSPGRTFAEIATAAAERGVVRDARGDPAAWVQQRLTRFREPRGSFVNRFADGRWIQVNERRTADGGVVAVYSDVTELMRREQELRAAKEGAEAANQAKSAFLANVSHELRTPLTSILGFTRIVQRRLQEVILPAIVDPQPRVRRVMEQAARNLEIVQVEGERLTTLINNVLDLEKIEAGEMTWQVEPMDVAGALGQAAAATRSLYEARGLDFAVAIEPDLPPVLGDHDRVVQVIVNLISNAVKFTREGGVRCHAAREGASQVAVSVTDTGSGIAEHEQPLVFDKFRQVGDTLTDKPAGTGLGLAICREIVEQLGGRIEVHSRLGHGSTFRFTLPVASGDPCAAGGRTSGST